MATLSAPTYRSGSQSVAAGDVSTSSEERAGALSFLQNLAAEVSKGSIDLPCFPEVVIRISQTLADPNTTTERVVTIVGAEPRLAARVLQTANSAAFNTSGKPLIDLRSAITRLGQQMVQATAMSYAMQHLKNESSLRAIAEPLKQLWNRSIAVASICKLLATPAKVSADEAFLTGLLHGIGNLYIMVRATGATNGILNDSSWMALLSGWQASIGKAVLQSWGFGEEMCDAIGDQDDVERRWKHEAHLVDVLLASLSLADALQRPEPRSINVDGLHAFQSIGVTAEDCRRILAAASQQINQIHEALA